MKIFIICSKVFFNEIPSVVKKLEALGHEVELPFGYDNPRFEGNELGKDKDAYALFKKKLYELNSKIIEQADAVLCLNFEKNGLSNYIGAGTFLILHKAFVLGKKIFLWNYIPSGILQSEIETFNPVIIKRQVKKIM